MEQSFREYTENRIESYQKIWDAFPEYNAGVNLDGLRDAYSFEEHMYKVKLQLEKFFGRELNWYEVDQFSVMINQFTSRSVRIFKRPETIQEKIDVDVLCRISFCKAIGLDFSELDTEDYRKAVQTNIENRENLHRNLSTDNNK